MVGLVSSKSVYYIKLCVKVTVTDWLCIKLAYVGAGSHFVMQPSNITVTEGDSKKLNCTMAALSEDIAIWVINGLEFYWTEFANMEVFSFDLRDNSLTIHNTPRSLDGTSFRCILDNHKSNIGYLTVLSLSPTPSITNFVSQIGE